MAQILEDIANERRAVYQQKRSKMLGKIGEQCKEDSFFSVMLEGKGKRRDTFHHSSCYHYEAICDSRSERMIEYLQT